MADDKVIAPRRIVVLGVGNIERGDDGVGRIVARLLRGAFSGEVEVVEQEGEATSLLAKLEGAAAAYLIDACRSGEAPGSVHRFDAYRSPLPQTISDVSTHGFGVAAAIELARALGRLPPRTIVYAIEGESFETGAALSPSVAVAAAQIADEIRSEIAANMS